MYVCAQQRVRRGIFFARFKAGRVQFFLWKVENWLETKGKVNEQDNKAVWTSGTKRTIFLK